MMGNNSSQNDFKDSDSESELSIEVCNNLFDFVDNKNPIMLTDAIGTIPGKKQHYQPKFEQKRIVLVDLNYVEENCLGVEEKVSLVFLLYENLHEALSDIKLIENGSKNLFLRDWLSRCTFGKKEIMLLEALSVIQNYMALKKLGYSKEESIQRFLPLQRHTSLYIDKIKKYLYRMFEDFDKKTQAEFVSMVKEDFVNTNYKFNNFTFLEQYFLYFFNIGYITYQNFRNVIKHLKVIDLEICYCDELKLLQTQTVIDKSPQVISNNQIKNINDKIVDVKQEPVCFSSNNLSALKNESLIYEINKNTPGILLIIEIENFYTEFENTENVEVYLNKVENRSGTEKDSTRLKETFKRFGFEIFYFKDKTNDEILEILHDVAFNKFKPEHSSFFIAILSHGLEGKVIAANSVPVEMREIKRKICSPQLECKPKVFILQFCQGEEILKAANNDSDTNLTTDGPKSGTISVHVSDILEIYSTVPGFASIRSPVTGSWFIQTFCEVIDKNPTASFSEICVLIQSQMSNKTWKHTLSDGSIETRVMVCAYTSTLKKLLYLPRLG